MVGLLVVTHGRLAEELVAAAQRIVGNVKGLEAVSIDWNDDVDDATRRIVEARERADSGSGASTSITPKRSGGPTTSAPSSTTTCSSP